MPKGGYRGRKKRRDKRQDETSHEEEERKSLGSEFGKGRRRSSEEEYEGKGYQGGGKGTEHRGWQAEAEGGRG